MKYYEMTTEQLETLKSDIEEKLNDYVGMSFPSLRSELVTYEIDSVDSDEILITANHYFNGLIRDYIVTIEGGVQDDVEYSRYVDNGDLIDGGYMSFERLSKHIRNAVLNIYALYRELEKIDDILDTRAEEEEEEETEESEEVSIADVLGFEGFDYDDVKAKLENDPELSNLLEKEEGEESKEEEESKKEDLMKRFEAYNAYVVNRDFHHIASALGFAGFDYDHFDDYFKAKLENDEKLGDLLEQLKDVESSQFLIYTQNKTDFYQKHEHDIYTYLKTYGYDDDYHMQTIEDIMCSRVVAYVTGVISEYGY